MGVKSRNFLKRCGFNVVSIICLVLFSVPLLPAEVYAEPEKKLVALTFDDGPTDNAEHFMDVLDQYGAKGTFFMRGKNHSGHAGVDVHPEAIFRMVREGHEPANHTYSHLSNFNNLSADKVQSEVDRVNQYIYDAYGREVQTLVRTPKEIVNGRIASEIDAPIIGGSLQTRDYLYHSAEKTYETVMNNIKDGDIVVMHENVPSSAVAMERFLPELQKKGFEFVTVSELFAEKGIRLQNGHVYNDACENTGSGQPVYRLYNPNTGEHFYSCRAAERKALVIRGWRDEGVGWTAPKAGKPVYRLYNPNARDHHYTMSEKERKLLIDAGWRDEGIGWYSGGDIPLYRQYNPNARCGSHNYTTSKAENDVLVKAGWRAEGISWYAEGSGRRS